MEMIRKIITVPTLVTTNYGFLKGRPVSRKHQPLGREAQHLFHQPLF